VTSPLEFIVATDELKMVHDPPDADEVISVLSYWHTAKVPERVPADGTGKTETV
jgi:hypothetical protein